MTNCQDIADGGLFDNSNDDAFNYPVSGTQNGAQVFPSDSGTVTTSKAVYTISTNAFAPFSTYTVTLTTILDPAAVSDSFSLYYKDGFDINTVGPNTFVDRSVTVGIVFLSAPTVTALSPTAGTTAGGTSVAITGTGFTGATSVTFGSTAATSFTENSATSITAVAPSSGSAGPVNVRVTTASGTSATAAGNVYTYVSPPTIAAAFSPTTITTAQTSTLTLTIANPNSVAMSGIAVAAAALPANLVGSGPSTNCGGTASFSSGQLGLSGGSLAAGASCSVTLTVSSATPSSYGYTTGAVSSATPATTGLTATTPASLTVNAAVPGAPTIGTATAGDGQATVAFTAPASDGGSAILDYTVTSAPGGIAATGAGSPIVVPGLTNGTAYTFTVTARNSTGNSPASGPSNSVTPIAPPIAGAAAATVAYNSTANPVTLALTGGAPDSVAVATQATNGTATASGTAITYTPNTGFFGADSFTYTATNASGTSTPATVSVTVSAPTITVAPTTLPAGSFGTFYSQSLTASGGAAPYSFATTPASGALPAGLSLASDGTVSGTPTASGTFTFTVSGTDASTATPASFTSAAISLTISTTGPGAPTIGTATAGDGQATVAFTAPASDGGSAILDYTVTSAPGGIAATGAGSPIVVPGLTNGTAYTFTVTARNSTGNSPASGPSNSVTPIAPPIAGAAAATVAYNSTANPVTLALTGGAPDSVAVATQATNGTATASGTAITYTPNTGFFGADSFTYTATNASGTSTPATVSVTVSAPTITVAPTTLPAGSFGTFYSQSLTASGGAAPYSFATTPASGALPAGLSLASDGTVSGTPTASGTFTFTVSGTDASTATPASFTSAAISLTISTTVPGAPTIGTATVGDGQATVAFTAPASDGGSAILDYTVTSAPDGIAATGAGSPIVVPGLTNGTAYTFTVTARNSIGNSPASGPSNSVTPIAPPIAGAAAATVAYNSTANPVTLALTGGAPDSVAVATQATNGTATASGTAITYTPNTGFFGADSFTYTATNASGTSTPATVSVTVSAPTITVAPTTLPAGSFGTFYSQSLTASGGAAPYSFATTPASGALPAGLSLASDGTVSGTPTASGTFTFTVSGTDASTATPASFTSAAISLTISTTVPGAPTIGTATVGDGQATVAFTAPASDGGSAILDYTVTSAPDGIAATGAGSPIVVPGLTNGTAYTFTVTARNSIGNSPASGPSNSVTPIAPPIAGAAAATVAYNSTANPVTLALTGGAPDSVAVATQATNGTATASGTAITYTPNTGFFGADSFTYTATNASGTSTPATVSVTVSAPTITVTPAVLTAGRSGVAYDQTITASGGAAPYSFATTPATGSLPPGLSLASDGRISGTPTLPGRFDFTVSGTDSSSATPFGFVSATLSLTIDAVAPAAPSIGSATAGDGEATVSFTAPTVDGGSPITGYTVTSSPGGLTATGAASPVTVTGLANGTSYTFTVTATNAAGSSPASAASNSVTPLARPVAEDSATEVTGTAATTIRPNLSGGEATSLTIVRGPALGTVSISGLTFVYTPFAGTSGADSFTFTASGPGGTSDVATLSLTLAPAVLVLSPSGGSLPGSSLGAFYETRIDASGGTAPYRFSLEAGRLPDGVTVDPSTGRISGTPGEAGTFTATIGASDSAGLTGTATYDLLVEVPQAFAPSQTASVQPGESVRLELTKDAIGGPFVDATLVSLTPPSAGDAVIVAGDTASLSDGEAFAALEGGRFFLEFRPRADFDGTAIATFTLTSSTGSTTPLAQITFVVVKRPDPAKDAETIALVRAQIDSARRMADDQIANFNERLEQLHDGSCLAPAMGIRIQLDSSSSSSADSDLPWERLSNAEANTASDTLEAPTAMASDDGRLLAGRTQRGDRVAPSKAREKVTEEAGGAGEPCIDFAGVPLSVWTGGYVSFGDNDEGVGFDFTTIGVSAGLDYRFSERFTGGFGFGYGSDETEIGSSGTRSDATAYSAAVYGSYHPTPETFLDALLGYSHLDFNSERFITDNAGLATGERDGNQIFGSVTAGYEYRDDGLLLSPYGRISASRTDLGAFSEEDGGVYGLSFEDTSFDTVTATAGLRGSYRIDRSWGSISPRLRVEYSLDVEGDSSQALAYRDAESSAGSSIDTPSQTDDYWAVGLGVDVDVLDLWTLGFDYGTTIGEENDSRHRLRATVGARF